MKKVFKNIIYLSTVKGFDLIVPILVMPYVIRVLGLEQYGIFSLALLYFNFLLSFSDFGQTLISVKDLARTDKKKEKIIIISQSISLKSTLSLLVISISLLVTYVSHPEYIWVVIAFSIGLIFEALSLSFFFQAEQEMKKISLIQLFSRLISTIPVFLLVNDSNDLELYCFLHVSPYVISASLIFILYKMRHIGEGYCFSISSSRISSGWKIYSYQMVNGLILPITSTFLAANFDVKTVAIFAVIQRILSSAYRVFEPSVMAIYPYLASLHRVNYALFRVRTYQIQIAFLIILSLCIFILNYFSSFIQGFIVGYVFKDEDDSLYKVMMFILIPMVVNLFSTRVMVIIGLESAISKILLVTTLIIFVCLFIVYYNSMAVFFVGVSLMVGYLLSMLLILLLLYDGTKNEK
ncbi:oligosaccharide flippase family protein [Aeromonas caviae]|uniref:oligosaccharide flippase family protein n=1 Tax=Aeromonas caviae TaxID=648 RepID=UPI002DD64373|nr:oligosaccharide flippase family protein [Aeromonas caviae]